MRSPFALRRVTFYAADMTNRDTVVLEIPLADPAATDALGRTIAAVLMPGTTVLLEGQLGAGKTALARAIIRARQTAAGEKAEEVPSPSYTLVQTYRAGADEIWHADLYRLSGAGDLEEIGLDAAPEGALRLIEWPDRLPPDAMRGALRIALVPEGTGRRARIEIPAHHAALAAALRHPLRPDPAHG